MGNIFSIIIRIFPFLVFAFYLFISFFFIGRSNAYYESNFIGRSNALLGSFHESLDDYSSYMHLREFNQSLSAENAKLRQNLFQLQHLQSQLSADSLHTTHRSQQPWLNGQTVISAKIIQNSVSGVNNFMIVDKGTADGVHKNMGVLSANGPVGMVMDATEHYASVMSFINKQMTLSARVVSTQHVGQLRWTGGDIRIALLDEIPKHIKLKKGDEIVTSGYSSYFPPNIPIGRVVQQKDDASNFANIKVQLYNDFANLHYTYLISNPRENEIRAIESRLDTIKKTVKSE